MTKNKIILIISLVFLVLAFFLLKDKTTNNVLIDTSANELKDSLLKDSTNIRIRNYDSVVIKHSVKTITDIKVNTVQGWEAKALFAFPGCILVDDSARNISDWVTSGGTGVLHTSNWNTLTDLNMLGILK